MYRYLSFVFLQKTGKCRLNVCINYQRLRQPNDGVSNKLVHYIVKSTDGKYRGYPLVLQSTENNESELKFKTLSDFIETCFEGIFPKSGFYFTTSAILHELAFSHKPATVEISARRSSSMKLLYIKAIQVFVETSSLQAVYNKPLPFVFPSSVYRLHSRPIHDCFQSNCFELRRPKDVCYV